MCFSDNAGLCAAAPGCGLPRGRGCGPPHNRCRRQDPPSWHQQWTDHSGPHVQQITQTFDGHRISVCTAVRRHNATSRLHGCRSVSLWELKLKGITAGVGTEAHRIRRVLRAARWRFERCHRRCPAAAGEVLVDFAWSDSTRLIYVNVTGAPDSALAACIKASIGRLALPANEGRRLSRARFTIELISRAYADAARRARLRRRAIQSLEQELERIDGEFKDKPELGRGRGGGGKGLGTVGLGSVGTIGRKRGKRKRQRRKRKQKRRQKRRQNRRDPRLAPSR